MREIFPEFYNLESNEIKILWTDCLFVFDANVLLNLYRYSLETSNNLISVLTTLSDRIWIPHQFALEYQRNRMVVREEQKNKYTKSVNAVIGELENIESLLKNNFKDPPFDTVKIKEDLNKSLESYPDCSSEDSIRDQIDILFKDKIGDPFGKEELVSIYKDGSERYCKEIPPGYCDEKNKDKNDPTKTKKFGDLIGWLQIIKKSKESKKSIIFITSEKKEDWWRKIQNKTVGPRHELISEFQKESGQLFYMYDMERFLSYAPQNGVIDDKMIIEVKKVEEINNDPLIDERSLIDNTEIFKFQTNQEDIINNSLCGIESSDSLDVEKELLFKTEEPEVLGTNIIETKI